MFVLEINFHDGVSPPETLLVRRPHAIIGTSEFAHVVIEGAPSIPCELRVTRGLGREFTCQPVKKPGALAVVPPFLEGVYNRETQFALGDVTVNITSLDIDLHLLLSDTPERASIKVLRAALARPTPVLPAIAVTGASPVFVSFQEGQPLLVGRSRKCGLRLDSSGVSGEHARMGFEQGQFWVEDLGSTNGTFVGSERISGRRALGRNDTVIIGNEFVLAGIQEESDLRQLSQRSSAVTSVQQENRYPCVVTTSELPKPPRVVLTPGRRITIGRDPASDIWVGAPYISRSHTQIAMDENGGVTVIDLSTNGTFLNGVRMIRNEVQRLPEGEVVIDLKQSVIFSVCNNPAAEAKFTGQKVVGDDTSGDDLSQDDSASSPQHLAAFGLAERAKNNLGNTLQSASSTLSSVENATTGGGAFGALAKKWSVLGSASNLAERDLANRDIGAEKAEMGVGANPAGYEDNEGFLGGEESRRYDSGNQESEGGIEDLTANYNLDDIQESDEEHLDYPRMGWVGWIALGLMLIVLAVIGVIIFSYLWK